MHDRLVAKISHNLGIEENQVICVIDEFLLQLHRGLYEYVGTNGDYLGEELHYQIGPQGFYHLLGLLDTVSERYGWEPGSASEYLHRLGRLAEWAPYVHQTESWVKGSQSHPGKSSV